MSHTNDSRPAVFSENDPIYSSRIISIYLAYLARHRSEIDADKVLTRAGISRYEAQDPAHWFSQRQIDRFHQALEEETKDPAISRSAGRYIASVDNMGPIRAFVVGLLNPAASYMLASRIMKQMSRGVAVTVKRTGRESVEITTRPEPGVAEKLFQCENRLGSLEGMAQPFTGELARVSHPECWHRGDDCCRYRVSWRRTPALNWKLLRNATILAALAGVPALLLLRPECGAAVPLLAGGLAAAVSALFAGLAENRALTRALKIQGDIGRDLIDESNIRYGNALLVQEIGQASSTIRDRDELIRFVITAVEQRLDFDRGLIMLADRDRRRLVYVAGFGYDAENEGLLSGTSFHLDRPEAKGLFVRCFWEQRPFLIEDIERFEADFSARSRRLARKLGAKSLICVPIVFEKNSFGILAVDNVSSKRPLKKSDMNLLMGVASQTAASIANAKAFQKIARSEEKYRSILEGIEEGYFEVDRTGSLTFFNEALCRISGRPAGELAGLNYRSFMTRAAAKQANRIFRSLYRGDRALKAQALEILRPDKTPRCVEVSASLIRSSAGSVSGVRGLARDVTERRKAEEDRRKLEARLMQAEKMEAVGTLAGGVAHDFNNLLMGIQGNISLMLMEVDAEDPLYEKLAAVEAYVEKSAHLTQQLLGFARKAKHKVQPLDLNESVEKSSELFGRTSKKIRITRRLAEKLWTVEADPGQIEQVLLNLYVNSLHAMSEGGELQLETENMLLPESRTRPFDKEPGRYVRIGVSDTGVGMEQATLQRIFEPFFTTKKPGEGTGLGLASVYGIVKNHRGFVDVASQVGAGTEFHLFFPAAEKQMNRIREAEADVLGGTEMLLVIDDEQMILDVAAEMLGILGYRVQTASNGPEGVERFRHAQAKIDLVILDMVMPEMSGAQVFGELRKIDPKIPVLVASGYSAEGQAARILENGRSAFIQKPFDITSLSHKIRSLLSGREGGAAGSVQNGG